MSEILKSKLTILQIFCSFNATRLNSVIAAGDITAEVFTLLRYIFGPLTW